MTGSPVVERIGELGIIPVVVIEDARQAYAMGEALKAGGLACAEVTFRTEAAEESLRLMAADPDLLVGAGTVTKPAQVSRALEAGARFIVSPGFGPAVVRECELLGVPVLPGVATATEIQMALDAGVSVVKFFPAEASGGVAAIRALSGPFRDVRFVPTGGILPGTLGSYLAVPSVVAVGGSWMVSPQLLAADDLASVTSLAAEAVELVRVARQGF